MSSSLKMEDQNILDHYTDLSVGDVFMRARQSYGLDIHQAAHKTLIRVDILEAIENNDKANLPSRVYAIGFVKAYANFLGLDADKMIYLFKQQVVGMDKKGKKKSKAESGGASDASSLISMLIFGGGALLILGSIGIFAYKAMTYTKNKNLDEHALDIFTSELAKPSLSDVQADSRLYAWKELTQADYDQKGPLGHILPDNGGKAYGKAWARGGMILKASASAWVKVTSGDGELLLNVVLQQGDVVQMSARNSYMLETTNAAALDVYLKNKKKGTLKGKDGENKEYILSRQMVEKLVN